MRLLNASSIRTILCALSIFTAGIPELPAQAERKEDVLEHLLTKIDLPLMQKCEQDIRARLDAKIQRFGDFGLYPDPDYESFLKITGDEAIVNFSHRGIYDSAADYFRAYEILGEKRYLAAALKTCDFFLKAQMPEGHWLLSYWLNRAGKVVVKDVHLKTWMLDEHPQSLRLQDGYQYCPFALLLWAYKLTGEQRYYDAAKRSADLVMTLQHPENGSCPDYYDLRQKDRSVLITGNAGVASGGSFNDGATSDPMRMAVSMYHLTKDEKYLERSAKIGQWLFDTQLGQGDVRGWCQQYGPHNEPASARNFEMPNIEPRTFDRFTAPMLIWFYVLTGNERYRTLFEETYQWMRSVEVPGPDGGWHYQYLTYGEPVFSTQWRVYRYDRPDTWPSTDILDPWFTKPSHEKVNLAAVEKIISVLQTGGLEGLRNFWYSRPTTYTPVQYLDARIAAAKRALLEDFEVTVGTGSRNDVTEMLRRESEKRSLLKTKLMGADASTQLPVSEIDEARSRRDFSRAQLQYVYDVRLAQGRIDADIAAKGGRGMESRYSEPWDVTSDWTLRVIEVENWLDIPFSEYE